MRSRLQGKIDMCSFSAAATGPDLQKPGSAATWNMDGIHVDDSMQRRPRIESECTAGATPMLA